MEKNKKVKMSPAARKLAKQMGINVGELQAGADVIRSKDILQAQLKNEEDIKLIYESAVVSTAMDLEDRYRNIMHEEMKARSYGEWLEAKEEQSAFSEAWISAHLEKNVLKKREAERKQAEDAWKEAADKQSKFRDEYLTARRREALRKSAEEAWRKAYVEQTKAREDYIARRTAEITAARRDAQDKAAYEAWKAAKDSMTLRRNAYLQKLEDDKINALWQQKKLAARTAWEEAKSEGDAKIAEFMDAYETAKYEKAYEEYIASLDEYNQVSVGKIEFDAEVIEEAMGDKDMSFNDAMTRFVASAVAKALIDIECPIYENGLMNVISLTGEKPIKTVRDAHEGDFTDLVYEDAVYFSKDIKVRIWDISVCGLESFFASQGGINVYINLDDDEIDLDVAIDCRVMMDLEALVFLMRMKEYLSED